jgi:uncharacterized protein YjbI with pentapeptide repeats
MTKKALGSVWVAGIFAALGLVGARPAQAGLGQVATLLRTPAVRYAVLERAESAELLSVIMGKPMAAGAKVEVEDVVRRLALKENAALLEQLHPRLDRIRVRFLFLAGEAASASDLLGKLAGEELGIRRVEQGLQFVEATPAATFSAEKEAFLKAGVEGAYAGQNFSGKVFNPGQSMVAADFRFADLSGAEGVAMDLEGAKLEGANLSKAQLTQSNFNRSTLEHASLKGARLKDASFRDASLVGADLSGAHLNGADFSGADLRGANLSGARMEPTFFRAKIEAKLDGALFDKDTKLPFSRAQAKQLGMVFVGE